MKTLITGGVKSGKSRHALELAAGFGPGPGPFFLATARAIDEEMRERIARHRTERDPRFETIEEPVAIHERVRDRMVVDCIPMWLNNLFFDEREGEADAILGAFIERLPRDIVIVTNEIGMGVIPADALSRRYGIALGVANTRLAAACDSVVLMVCGLPLAIKAPGREAAR
jgi:adenosylcobinamide kinase/adenosylcobinamide-phosphate guanylyltransferase